jgi:hypothetical protein
MKIATGIVVVTLALAVAADAATQVPEKYRNKDKSVAWSSGALTTLEYHDKLVRQQARENKINALNRRCEGDNSPLCRKHNDR